MQTETPFWLDEAYQNPISVYDVGKVHRNLFWRAAIERMLPKFFNPKSKFIDYGGGTGLLVRLMRDSGFDFYRYDRFSDNLFAKGFDIFDCSPGSGRFELLTAFEVFEHLEKPRAAIEEMFKFSDSILFSTLLQPKDETKINPEGWDYFALPTGQHISFYTKESLNEIASRFGCYLYSDNDDTHLLTPKKLCLSPAQFRSLLLPGKKQKIYEFMRDFRKQPVKMPEPTISDFKFILKNYQSKNESIEN